MTSHGAVEGEIGNCQPRDGWFGCGRKGEDATVGGVQPVAPRGDTATARGGRGGGGGRGSRRRSATATARGRGGRGHGSRGGGCAAAAAAARGGRRGARAVAQCVAALVVAVAAGRGVPVTGVAIATSGLINAVVYIRSRKQSGCASSHQHQEDDNRLNKVPSEQPTYPPNFALRCRHRTLFSVSRDSPSPQENDIKRHVLL